MRAAYLRAPGAVTTPDGSSWSSHLLRAYLDLTATWGPVHAQTVADAGRRLAANEPMPSYQINTLSILRSALAAEPGGCAPIEPADIPEHDRSPRWSHLCELITEWAGLSVEDRARVATVLSKLGFWKTVCRLMPEPPPTRESPAHSRLALLRCNAFVKLSRPGALAQAQLALSSIAENAAFPHDLRRGAAVNLVVHHAKADRSLTAMQHWADLARHLRERSAPDDLIAVSAYWRGVSFVPFLEGRHYEVRGMLDEAEDAARAALADQRVPQILALENLHPLLETRGRAAISAGDRTQAERYYRELTHHDPYDAKVHARLGDFLYQGDRWDEARSSYEMAATLGVPFTAYALTQAARCSQQLAEPERAVAVLAKAVQADPKAVTPLVLLREAARKSSLTALTTWCDDRLRAMTSDPVARS